MRYQSTTVRLAPPLRSRCDGDHKNALFCRVLQMISACMTTKPVACSQERSPRRLWAKSALPPDATNRSDLASGFVLSLMHSSSSSTLLAASSSLLGKVTLCDAGSWDNFFDYRESKVCSPPDALHPVAPTKAALEAADPIDLSASLSLCSVRGLVALRQTFVHCSQNCVGAPGDHCTAGLSSLRCGGLCRLRVTSRHDAILRPCPLCL